MLYPAIYFGVQTPIVKDKDSLVFFSFSFLV